MKVAPRSLLAPRELELPSGLKVSVFGSPDLLKLVRAGKIPLPLATKFIEASAASSDDDAQEATLDNLMLSMEFQEALVLAVVKCVHYVDEDGTVYDLPLVKEAKTDEEFPYDVLVSDDVAYLFNYANGGVGELATFPEESGSAGNSDDGGEIRPKTKRAPRAKAAV